MNWIKFVLVSLYAVSAVLTVKMIGKKREPITPGLAAWMVACNIVLATLVILA